jgi:hypothetical protein
MYIKSIIAFFFFLPFFISCSNNKNIFLDDSVIIDIPADEILLVFPELDSEPEPEQVMVYYEGSIVNIFFHPLVARPETAFTSNRRDHFLDWYVTADEYKKLLYELYINDFVLIDINELYDVNYVNGQKRVNFIKPLVPEGKKPMILSIDDLNYYENQKRYATVHKLVLDENGNIAAWTDNVNGGEISYDLDVVTYLEYFISQYPDFSIRGAKGIIALTGFEGVLGYRTHRLNAPDYQAEKEQAVIIVNKLKELGWRFASHSWGHPNLATIPMTRFMTDVDRWDREVRPITGDTNLFIYPFGEGVEHIEERHKVLRDRNFIIFFDVGTGYGFREKPEYLYFTRRSIDGVYFRTFRNRPDKLFDFDIVVDTRMRSLR